ncbi:MULTISPECIES: hypothetical protein [unclassified Cytobacillus]|uniref:hypothetical protein n=1 Tax=unclassified Cytobacillus TaxID=2675268 RepID=UPI00135C274D|nr:hypothetical protein [Cytobacillus sp. AMY 15.2]KAF0818927.1 hypothetical protein KIS4809_2219 [Bacillus sp. ZZV12-4809]MCM3092470.1 hypothetical protein [Cytobacillus sp. AMY 15.2]
MSTIDIFKKELTLLIAEMDRCKNAKIKKQILNDIRHIQSAVQNLLNEPEQKTAT